MSISAFKILLFLRDWYGEGATGDLRRGAILGNRSNKVRETRT